MMGTPTLERLLLRQLFTDAKRCFVAFVTKSKVNEDDEDKKNFTSSYFSEQPALPNVFDELGDVDVESAQ